MELIENYTYTFKPFIGGESQCKVEIYLHNNIDIILFKNISGGGVSVTNASELLATNIVKDHKLDPKNCRFFETYPEYEGHYDEIIYKWDENNIAHTPIWKPEYVIEPHIINTFKRYHSLGNK